MTTYEIILARGSEDIINGIFSSPSGAYVAYQALSSKFHPNEGYGVYIAKREAGNPYTARVSPQELRELAGFY